jgi:hypothetical protein
MRWLLLAGLLAALAAAAPASAATNECRGLQVCIPVAGPWVVVPPTVAVPRSRVEFDLACPPGTIVGGLDAELTDRAIDLQFLGALGAPVNPGITTARDAVFLGTYVGMRPRTPSFRPHVGCMPASGGGSRTPTSAFVATATGAATVRHVKNVTLRPGRRVVAQACKAGERLVGGSYAVAFGRPAPPTAALAAAVTATQALRGERVTVAVRAAAAVRGQQAILQVSAVCAGGR